MKLNIPAAARARTFLIRMGGPLARVRAPVPGLAPDVVAAFGAVRDPVLLAEEPAKTPQQPLELRPGGRQHLRFEAAAVALRDELLVAGRGRPLNHGWPPWFRRAGRPLGNFSIEV